MTGASQVGVAWRTRLALPQVVPDAHAPGTTETLRQENDLAHGATVRQMRMGSSRLGQRQDLVHDEA